MLPTTARSISEMMMPTTTRSTPETKKRPHRPQSLNRIRYKIDAIERSDDIPNCPKAEDVLGNRDNIASEELPSYSAEDNRFEPYEDLQLEKEAAVARGIQPLKCNSEPDSSSFHSAAEADDEMSPTAQTHRHCRHSIANTVDSMTVQRELRIALVTNTKQGQDRPGERRRKLIVVSRSFNTVNPPSDRPEDSNNSMDAIYNNDKGDDFDCCAQLWELLVKSFLLLVRFFNFVLDHKILLYPLALFVFYLFLGMLHSMMASMMASGVGLIWPPTHFFLSTSAGFIWRMADWLMWVDELGRSLICDMAANYCRRYRLLCDRQCSFVDRAMEHGRAGRCF